MAGVIERAVTILKMLIPDTSTKEWGASEISRRSGIPVCTVHRILLELKEQGLVEQNEVTKKFKLGLLLMELGFIVRDHLSIREVARPVMESLHQETQETVHLAIQDGCDGVLIDKIDTPHAFRLVEPLGMRTPLTQGALKKAILAFLPLDEIKMIIEKSKRVYDNKGISFAPDELMADLEGIRKKVYALSYGEVTPGTVAMAAPVFNFKGKVVAAIGISGPEIRFSSDQMPHRIEAVLKAGAILTQKIGGNRYPKKAQM